MRTITQHDPQTPRLQSQALGKDAGDLADRSEQNQETLPRAGEAVHGRVDHHPFHLADCRRQPRARLEFSAPTPGAQRLRPAGGSPSARHPAVPAICVFGNTA